MATDPFADAVSAEPVAPGRGRADAHSDRMYRGASRAERDAARRSRLLDAGLEVFGTEGYAASTIEGLCTRAGVSTRHFYDHFHSREELLLAVYDRIVLETRDRVVGVVGANDDLRSQMRAGITAYVVPLLADTRLARIIHLEVIGVSPALERHRRSMIHAFAAIIEAEARRLLDANTLAQRDVRLVSLGLVGATTELMVDWVLGANRTSVEHVVDELVHVYVSSFSA
jgi:AcrR family transcriptional regulator